MSSRLQGRLSITITLTTAIGLLVLIAAGSVLGVGVWLAQKNTFSLLSENANQGINAATSQVEQHLRAAEHQVDFIARLITQSEVSPDDKKMFGQFLLGALAAAPQIEAVMFINPDSQALIAGQSREDQSAVINEQDFSDDPTVQASMGKISFGPTWLPPIWREQFNKTYLNLAQAVIRDGVFVGAVVAVVSVEQLSLFVATTSVRHDAGTHFILYGRDQVIAHSLLSDGYTEGSDEAPLPTVANFPDPVIAAMWTNDATYDLKVVELAQGTDGHVIQLDDAEYIFIYRDLPGFGPLPLRVGAYFQTSDIGEEVRRMIAALIAGVVVLILSVVAAIFVGRHIARPIVQFSAAAGRIRDLEIPDVKELPGSIFRELNEQANSFNAMLGALRWFELYVPRKIVESLIKRGAPEQALSDAREITVMFTDIVGFSSASEGMKASEVAAFVNAHFSLVVECVEAEGGTVDKFIGDSVMAFWGAPDAQDDAAMRACRAGLAIARRMNEENSLKAARGEPPVRIRVGIHSGSATVGNIGAPGRLNYTIIGDVVNIGQRLEQLGKELYEPGTEVAILISAETANRLDASFNPLPAGHHKVKGRVGEIEVFKLQ